jgi:hypothetical protein
MKVDCTVHYSSFCLYFFFHAELGTFRETAVLRVFVAARKVGRAFALRQRFIIKWMEASVAIQGFSSSLLSRGSWKITHASMTNKITPALQQSAGIPT